MFDSSTENGVIEFEEFLVLMGKHLKEPADEERELKDAFQVFDRDGNNYIDSEEIRFVMKSIGEKLTDQQISEIFKVADVNKDGKIDYEGKMASWFSIIFATLHAISFFCFIFLCRVCEVDGCQKGMRDPSVWMNTIELYPEAWMLNFYW